jgi:predicted transcriptional regulator
MARVTISLPQSIEELARESAREGESFSATVARLIEQGAAAERGSRRPRYVASGDGPADLGEAAERYLADTVEAR